jgi:catechol 2,3-dioxygenase
VATLDEVFRARDFLKDQGIEIKMEGRRRAGCQLEIEFLDPNGYRVEIYCLLDKVGENGWVRPGSEWNGVVDSLEKAVANPVPGQDTTYYYSGRVQKT